MTTTTKTPTAPPASRVVTLGDVVTLSVIIGAAQRCAQVARAVDGKVIYGTARSVGQANSGFACRDDDVRDLFLWVTTTAGLEAFWPVAELMADVESGAFTEIERSGK